jgi:hypothetical protein
LLNEKNLNSFLNYPLNNLIVGDKNRLFGGDFNKPWNFNTFFNDLLNFINLRHFMNYLHNFLLNSCDLLNSFLDLMGVNRLLSYDFDLSYFFSNIRSNLLNLLNSLLKDVLLFNFCKFLYSWHLFNDFYNFFHFNWN